MEDVIREIIIDFYKQFEKDADQYNENFKDREIVKNLPNFMEWLMNN